MCGPGMIEADMVIFAKPMKKIAAILLMLSVAGNAAVPRQLDTIVANDMVHQAMRCQSVLLYYSFFASVPIQIMNAMYTGQPAAADQDASGSRSEKNNAAAPLDFSVPGKTMLIKTTCVRPVPDDNPAGVITGIHAICIMERVRHLAYSAGWASTAHRWTVMLPRGSIDEHIGTIILNVNGPIGIPSQLAFSLGSRS